MPVSRVPKKPPKEFSHMEIHPGEDGGAVVTHHFTSYEHKPEMHPFSDGDGHKLAAHIEKHIGIAMPGKSVAKEDEPEEEEENVSGHAGKD